MTDLRPLVGVTCCLRPGDEFPFHAVGDKYVSAALTAAGVLPLLIPALGPRLPIADLIARLDGLLLTGSPSNIEPHHYDGPPPPPDNLTDPDRDATSLPLIRAAVAAGVPVFGICRGLQELNVALGGSLHQEVHTVPGRFDHREPKGSVPVRYGPKHSISIRGDGWLATLAESAKVTVNSLHGQGIDRVAPGLTVEAWAEDGQIEAVYRPGPSFCAAVQWHPEWRFSENPLSIALFQAFGAACRARLAAR